MFFKGLFVEDVDAAGVVGAAGFLDNPEYGEVFVTADVDADVEFGIGFVGRFFPIDAVLIFSGGDEVV